MKQLIKIGKRRCGTCREIKPISQFIADSPSGKNYRCKKCSIDRIKSWQGGMKQLCLSDKEIFFLYRLVNNHLNLIGEFGGDYFDVGEPAHEYINEFEKLERRIMKLYQQPPPKS